MSGCNCQRQAEKDLDAVIQGELAIHQCSALVQTIYFLAEAVTMARMFTDSFSGISPISGWGFIGAQVLGMLIALTLVVPVITASKEKNNV